MWHSLMLNSKSELCIYPISICFINIKRNKTQPFVLLFFQTVKIFVFQQSLKFFIFENLNIL